MAGNAINSLSRNQRSPDDSTSGGAKRRQIFIRCACWSCLGWNVERTVPRSASLRSASSLSVALDGLVRGEGPKHSIRVSDLELGGDLLR